jgi:glycolate oxidase FAD binding subunit
VDLIVSTARLDRLVEHSAGDLVATAQAGMRLADLQRVVGAAGQRLALDPPQPEATVGGIVAANASGPRRLRFGSVRDLLIGIRVVLADGAVVRAGGKVVKNVAGYDLCKLFTGSLGTLGLIVEATFRLHPLPAAQRMVRVDVDSPEDAAAAVQALLQSSLVPSAIELRWPAAEGPGTLAVLFEGLEAGVEAQAATAAGLAGRHGRTVVLDEAAAERLWREVTLEPVPAGEIRLKVSFLPSELAAVMRAVFETGVRYALPPRAAGSAGHGIVFVDLPAADASAQADAIGTLRRRLRGASVVVLEAPRPVKALVDVWPDPGDALPLMRRVKERFDPAGILSPGRFVGGL